MAIMDGGEAKEPMEANLEVEIWGTIHTGA